MKILFYRKQDNNPHDNLMSKWKNQALSILYKIMKTYINVTNFANGNLQSENSILSKRRNRNMLKTAASRLENWVEIWELCKKWHTTGSKKQHKI